MIAIVRGKVMTITQGTLERGTVLVEDGCIAAVGKEVEIPDDAQVLDAAGMVVMPGLIDAHCHLGLLADGVGRVHFDSNEPTDPITPHLRALDAIHPQDPAFKEVVEAGVTTVLICPGSANLIGGQCVCLKTAPQRTVEQMVLLEPAGVKMALGENPKQAHGEQKRSPSSRMGSAAMLRAALVDAQNYLERWSRYEAELAEYQVQVEREKASSKVPIPPERNLKLETLGKVLRREMKTRIHAHRADDLVTAIRIAEEFNLDFTLEHATEGFKIADVLAAKGIPVTAGPFFFDRNKYELKNLHPKNPGVLARAGVKVAIQTDAASCVKYLAISAALAVREGMLEDAALKAITFNAAEIIGVADRVGSLEVGKDADVVIFSGHPFDYCTVVEWVLVNGQIVHERERD